MLINTKMGSKDSGHVCESPPVQYKNFPTPEELTSPEIPAPPPLPTQTSSEPPRGLLQRIDPKRRSRLRNFNWEAIPMEKVKGRSSLWSSQTFQGDLQIDTGTMEELFGKQDEEIPQRSYNPRRSLSVGDAHVSKVFLLDSRRSMNIGILLKQFKRSAAQIVEDVRMGTVDTYSSERLAQLLKHLPDRDEVQRLQSFQGDRERLSEADLFILLLLDVPSYYLRLETLILKKDFHPAIVSQLSAARDLKAASEELLHCSDLHFILKLVLEAGNFMNAGGYAGNAAGFRVSSLLKLADTKANKPGMNLLHFVVMEVQKKDPKYLSFADTIKHVQSASRLSEESLLEEFDRLQSRVRTMRKNLATHEQHELRGQMEEFLEHAEEQLQEVQKEIEELRSSKKDLLEFLCEDEDTFHLEECCRIFSCFCHKFHTAIKENKLRQLEEQRRQQWERKRLQKRHSMATCSSLEAHQAVDELELTLERNLQNLCRTSSARLCRVRSFGSKSPSNFVPQSQQRERIQVYCNQRNAEEMREMSERVLWQQMEYKGSKTLSPGDKTNFYPVSKILMNSYCQSAAKADIKKSLPKDRTEISQPSLEIEEPPGKALTLSVRGVNKQKPQHVCQLKDQYGSILVDSSSASKCPASCATKVETDTQREITEQSGLSFQSLENAGLDILGQSKELLETTKPKQAFDHVITSKQIKPLHGPGMNRQSPLQFTCEQSLCQSKASLLTHPEMEVHWQMPHLSGPKATREEPLSQCKYVAFTEKPTDGMENTVKNGLETDSQQPQPRSRIPQYPSGLETFKPTYSDSQNSIESSIKPSPECSKKSIIKSNVQALYQQGIKTLSKQRDNSNSQIAKQLSGKQRDANKSQILVKPAVNLLDLESLSLTAPQTSRDSVRCIKPDTHEQPLTSNIFKTKQVTSELNASIPSVAQPESEMLSSPMHVSEEQQRSLDSSKTFKQHKLENVNQTLAPKVFKSSTETLTPVKSETLAHTHIHLDPETLREDDSPRQSSLKIPKQYIVKSFKQTLVKSAPKNTKQSVAPPIPPASSPSLVQTRSDTCSPDQTPSKAELPRNSQSKLGCFMSRIKHVEHLSIKQPAKDINGQEPPQSQDVVEPQHEVSSMSQSQDIEYNYYAKGLKDYHVSVHREAPIPCPKWKRELKKASDNADRCRVELKVENGNMELDQESTEQKLVDKSSALGRTGSNLPKKLKHDHGTRRFHMNKDVTLGSVSSLPTKQPVSTKQVNTETRDSKIPQKVSAGPLKPPSMKIMGSFKEKRESTRSNNSDSGKSELKNSPMVTSRHPASSTESTGHDTEHAKEPLWPSKKANSVARVAVHVIKHEVNSTLPRGSRNPYLTTQPVWR